MTTGLCEVIAAIGRCIETENDFEERTACVADLLLEFAGPPSRDGVNSGSDAKIKEVAVEAKKRFRQRMRGFGSFDYLRQLRRTAFRFPPGERSPGVPFSLMIVACDPETLRGAMARAKKDGRQCSAGFIRKFRENQNDDDQRGSRTRLRELERRLIEDARFYRKSVEGDWSSQEREILATKVRELIGALTRLSSTDPMQYSEAA